VAVAYISYRSAVSVQLSPFSWTCPRWQSDTRLYRCPLPHQLDRQAIQHFLPKTPPSDRNLPKRHRLIRQGHGLQSNRFVKLPSSPLAKGMRFAFLNISFRYLESSTPPTLAFTRDLRFPMSKPRDGQFPFGARIHDRSSLVVPLN
jgi:hypothetical protein